MFAGGHQLGQNTIQLPLSFSDTRARHCLCYDSTETWRDSIHLNTSLILDGLNLWMQLGRGIRHLAPQRNQADFAPQAEGKSGATVGKQAVKQPPTTTSQSLVKSSV